jgi:hypothetical protein
LGDRRPGSPWLEPFSVTPRGRHRKRQRRRSSTRCVRSRHRPPRICSAQPLQSQHPQKRPCSLDSCEHGPRIF